MNDYMTVFGWKPTKHTRTDWKEYWDLVYETDDQMLFMSKETYHYDEPENERCKLFDYNLVLEFQILELEEGDMLYSVLYLVPTMNYIYQEIKSNIMKSYCMSEEDIHLTDLLTEYQFPVLAQEEPDLELEIFNENNAEMSKWLLSTSIVSENINRLLGLYLDRVVNYIGTTNWDLLDGALTGIDPFKTSLDRVSKQMKGGKK